MPEKLISCASLPPATISSVPIYDYAVANEELARMCTDGYYPCCGKSICRGCIHSFCKSGNTRKCPFCNADLGKREEEDNEDLMTRVEANDAASICMLASQYYLGRAGFQQDQTRAIELYVESEILVIVRRIISWLTFIMKEGI